jgi:hypothetical protein
MRSVEVAARNSSAAWVHNGARAGQAVIVYAPASVRVRARALNDPLAAWCPR